MALRDAAVRRGLHVSEYGVLDDATGETHRCETRGARSTRCSAWSTSSPSCARTAASSRRRPTGTLPDADRARRPARRPALPHDRLGRDRVDRGDGAAPRATPATSTWRSPTTRRASASATTSRPTGLREQIERIRCRTDASTGSSCSPAREVNILPDGSLDYDDELLAELDWVVAIVHSSFRMASDDDDRADRARDRAPARRRDRPPVGPQDRAPAAVRVRLRARGRGGRAHAGRCSRSTPAPTGATSTTSTPARRPRAGVPIVINCDAHRVGGFEVARYGIATARRAWLTAADVANTRPWAERLAAPCACAPTRLAAPLTAAVDGLRVPAGLGRSTGAHGRRACRGRLSSIAPARSRQPRWIATNQASAGQAQDRARSKKFSRSPRMWFE